MADPLREPAGDPRHDPLGERVRELDTVRLLPIVVGAHLEAEITDRPRAGRLREEIRSWPGRREITDPLEPVIVTDLWYLNADDLRRRPTITIGRPEINAVTAHLAGRIPTAFMVEETYRIQLDPEYVDLNVCIWGPDGPTTGAAVERFLERYLAEYLHQVHEMIAD